MPMFDGASQPSLPSSNALGAVVGAGEVDIAEEGAAAISAQHLVARLPPRLAAAIALHGHLHRAGHAAIGGDVGEGDVNQPGQVLLNERRALEGRGEDRRVRPFAVAVVEDGVLEGVACGNPREARRDARPDLRADERAATVLEPVVVGARERRQQARAHVDLGIAVLRPVRADVQQPVLPQRLRVNGRAALLQGDQPQELDVQVVIRQRFALEVLRVEGDVVHLPAPLERRAERTPDVLPHPAAQHLLAIAVTVQDHRHLLGGLHWEQCSHRRRLMAHCGQDVHILFGLRRPVKPKSLEERPHAVRGAGTLRYSFIRYSALHYSILRYTALRYSVE